MFPSQQKPGASGAERARAKRRLPGLALLPVAALAVPPGFVNAGHADAGPVSLPPATIEAIDRVLGEVVESGQAAGLAVGVSVNGSSAFVRGYGIADLEHDVPVTGRTAFRIGSITKQFTASGILLLAEEGKVSVDDPLSEYLPDFPRAGEVTVRQLLNHTSGIRSYTAVGDFRRTLGRRTMTTDQMVDYIANLDGVYEFDPGTGWSYSNSGYYLLGAIIERVSGQSYASFMKAHVFDPLGLHDTAVDDTAEVVPHRANGYESVEDVPGRFRNASWIDMSVVAAAGAMRSTAGDLLKWERALFGGEVLTPKSLAMMIEPSRLKNGQLSGTVMQPGPSWQGSFEYGFGLAISKDEEGRRIVRHNGAISGFNAFMRSYPEQRISVVLLANTGNDSALVTGPKVAEIILDGHASEDLH